MKIATRCRTGMFILAIAAGGIATAPVQRALACPPETHDHPPRVATLFPAAEMPHTERTVTIGPRIFVTSDANLFEVVSEPHGKLNKVALAQASATLADGSRVPAAFLALAAHGHVLYATATAFTSATIPYASMLYRIELGPRPGEIAALASAPFQGHATPFLPNGMAVDRSGDIYVANSFSAVTNEAAILKLDVRPAPFMFQETIWLPASLGGAFPNGLQLDGHTLYLASLSNILQVTIHRDGSAGSISTLYSASPDNFLDDFAVLDRALVVCEIDNPFASPTSATSQLTVVTRMGSHAGTVERVIPLGSAGIFPSSVVELHDGPRGGETLLMTDYATGGLFKILF